MHYSVHTLHRVSSRSPLFPLFIALLLMVTGLWGISSPSQAATSLLIRNVTPVDAHSGTMKTQDIFILDGRIAAMGPKLDVPASATVIDGTGQFLSPGLWDMHVHLSYDPRFVDLMPELFLDYGITSVRDTGGNLKRLLPIIQSHYRSAAQAPRVFFAGPLLDGSPVVYGGTDTAGIGQSTVTAEDARTQVQALHASGVDFIKIYEMVSPEVFGAFVEEASELKLPIAAHVPLSMLASDAGPQVQSMEHLRNIEMDCAENAEALLEERRRLLAAGREQGRDGMGLRSSIHRAQRDKAIQNESPDRCERVLDSLTGTIQVPTARLNAMTQYPPFAAPDWLPALNELPDAVSSDWGNASTLMDPDNYRLLGEWTLGMIPRLAARGIAIGAGTDTPIGWGIPGYSLHRELEVMVEAGLSERSALAAATLVPARFFGLEALTGRVAADYQADLLLLEANPLEDIRHTRKIRMVVSKGQIARDYTEQ
ncbi:amidohydrolase family protein [Congregibacter sp.]|uniref:amidohydrolase family protein n=1 Tax=Congregibacter sp. TaxID=2744308 RepID=UPI003F6B3309